MEPLKGCDHCGTVLRAATGVDPDRCDSCDRLMRRVDPAEARVLIREKRIAEQFRRVASSAPAARRRGPFFLSEW